MMNPSYLLAGLLLWVPLAGVTQTIRLDIDSNQLGTTNTAIGFTSLLGSEGNAITIDGVTLTIFGAVGGHRDRGTPDDLLRDFTFKDGAGAATALRMSGLPAGLYDVQSWHFDNTFPSGEAIQVEFRPQGGAAVILVDNFAFSTSPASYQISVADGINYELVFREDTASNRSRFNGITITPVPEPSTFVLLGLGLLGIGWLSRKRV